MAQTPPLDLNSGAMAAAQHTLARPHDYAQFRALALRLAREQRKSDNARHARALRQLCKDSNVRMVVAEPVYRLPEDALE